MQFSIKPALSLASFGTTKVVPFHKAIYATSSSLPSHKWLVYIVGMFYVESWNLFVDDPRSMNWL